MALMNCPECENQVSEYANICPHCGFGVKDFLANQACEHSPHEEPSSITVVSEHKNTNHFTRKQTITTAKPATANTFKEKIVALWCSLGLFYKITSVASIIVFLLLEIGIFTHKFFPVALSILQIAGLVIAILMHHKVINAPKAYLKYIVLALSVIFTVLNVMSYTWGSKIPTTTIPPQTGNSNEQQTADTGQTEQSPQKDSAVHSITKGTEYAYMVDAWDVYIARAVSDDIIKIENWSKSSSSKKSVSFEYEVGTFRINDPTNGFAWVDEDHTAFVITFTDKNDSQFKKGGIATFTINISDSDTNKGSNFSENIACYSIQNDDWHMYRAIPLTDTLFKIECWYRGNSSGTFLFGYDVFLIDISRNDTDFEWTDDEHTSFSITMKDPQNEYYWEEETFVVFELETEGYQYANVKAYLDIWKVGDGEAAVPASASSFKYTDYRDVQKELENAGFTNITTNILYDIFWGWTAEGEVDSVSIDGRTNYEKGEVFKLDVPIVITYHMKEEDNPNKSTNTSASNNESTESKPSESEPPKSPVFYSTNTRDTVNDGNSGVYAYKSKGGSYDIYWIIDFDTGYVYYFTEGNGESTCDRLKIDSGDLNTAITITYHDGNDTWSYKLHFKYVNHAEHLVMNDHNGFDYDYYTTDLSAALRLRDTKRIKDY